jgi:hypothetical protein
MANPSVTKEELARARDHRQTKIHSPGNKFPVFWTDEDVALYARQEREAERERIATDIENTDRRFTRGILSELADRIRKGEL